MQSWSCRENTFYDADYDKVIDSDGSITEFIYVDDHVVMMQKNRGAFIPYIGFVKLRHGFLSY